MLSPYVNNASTHSLLDLQVQYGTMQSSTPVRCTTVLEFRVRTILSFNCSQVCIHSSRRVPGMKTRYIVVQALLHETSERLIRSFWYVPKFAIL